MASIVFAICDSMIADRLAMPQTGKHTERQTDRGTDRQRDRQTGMESPLEDTETLVKSGLSSITACKPTKSYVISYKQ